MANKAAAILEMINKGMSNKEIRTRMKVSPSYLWKLRNQMAHKAEEPFNEEVLRKATKGTGVNPKRVALKGKAKPDEIDEILDARGDRYGDFKGHAEITQIFKILSGAALRKHSKTLAPDQQEALDMIFHKIGRILNGDPDYADSWVDIAGYAKLVADRLQGTVR